MEKYINILASLVNRCGTHMSQLDILYISHMFATLFQVSSQFSNTGGKKGFCSYYYVSYGNRALSKMTSHTKGDDIAHRAPLVKIFRNH